MSRPRPARSVFPQPQRATADGLLCVGGHLTTDWLIDAYRHGIFPWPVVDRGREILAWFSPDPRAILELDKLHVSRRLMRRIQRREYHWTRNQSFGQVIRACANRGTAASTWITPSIIAAYESLHQLGLAHSIEVWHGDQLAGGIYGVAIGASFSAESMFHHRTDASKSALYFLVQHLRQQGFTLLDVQQTTKHLVSLGATTIPRDQFLSRLTVACDMPVEF